MKVDACSAETAAPRNGACAAVHRRRRAGDPSLGDTCPAGKACHARRAEIRHSVEAGPLAETAFLEDIGIREGTLRGGIALVGIPGIDMVNVGLPEPLPAPVESWLMIEKAEFLRPCDGPMPC